METIKRKSVSLIDLLAITALIGLIAGYYNIITHSVNAGDKSFSISLRAYGNRKYSKTKDTLLFSPGAPTTSVIFACFTPIWIPTLNYYSMSLM